jgi:hypothetical protein
MADSKTPLVWLFVLVSLSVLLLSYLFVAVPSSHAAALGAESGCLPVLEMRPDGSFSGRLVCASTVQRRELCEGSALGTGKKGQ